MEEERLEDGYSPGEEKLGEADSPEEEKLEDEYSPEEEKLGDADSPGEEPSDDDVHPSPDAESEEAGESESRRPEEGEPSGENGAPENPPEKNEPLPTPSQPENPPAAVDCLNQIQGRLESIDGTEQRLFSEVREMHKLYHTEFAGRLQAMQKELDRYHEIDKGRAYDDILESIARIYVAYETLPEEVEELKAKKNIEYMLMDIEDLLKQPPYEVEKLRSAPGEKRNPRHCQVLKRIPTDDPAKHDTIAKTYSSGFHVGNRTVVKEQVDIYIYEESAAAKAMKKDQTIETGDTPETK